MPPAVHALMNTLPVIEKARFKKFDDINVKMSSSSCLLAKAAPREERVAASKAPRSSNGHAATSHRCLLFARGASHATVRLVEGMELGEARNMLAVLEKLDSAQLWNAQASNALDSALGLLRS
eukprot:2157066-Amphidinium_carterae.1